MNQLEALSGRLDAGEYDDDDEAAAASGGEGRARGGGGGELEAVAVLGLADSVCI